MVEKETVKKDKEASRPPGVRAQVFKASRATVVRKQQAAASRALEEEDKGWKGITNIVEPLYDPSDMAQIPENSNILPQCVDAMEVNCDGFGHSFPLRDPRLAKDEALKKEIEDERLKIIQFFSTAAYPDSFTKLRRKTRQDKESTGNGYWEVLDAAGPIAGFRHLPSHTMRLVRKEAQAIEFEFPVVQVDTSGKPQIKNQKMFMRFRKYVQLLEDGSKVYFKELGDPRDMDYKTGEYKDGLAQKDKATSVFHFRIYSPRTPYGVPRWIGNLFSVFGSRSAEEINYKTFENNMVPALALLVSGGKITEGTVTRIQEFLEDIIAGSKNYSEILLIEAESSEDQFSQQGSVRVDLKPLVEAQKDDAMFVNYDKNNRAKVRQAFRMSGILIGEDEGFNRATATEARKMSDEQVFSPERNDFDWEMNMHFFPRLNFKYHRYESRRPIVTDPNVISRILTAAEKAGGLTPAIAREIMELLLGRDLPEIDPNKLDPDTPMSIQVAERAKKLDSDGIQGDIKTPTMKSESLATALGMRLLDLDEALEGRLGLLELEFEKDA